MKYYRFFIAIFIGILLPFLSGCISWEPGWKLAKAAAVKGDVKILMEKAGKLEGEADSGEKLRQLIRALEEVLKADPENREALHDLGCYQFLLGYAYCDNLDEKKENYRKAIQYNERALYGDPDFKALVDKGEPVWDACRVIKKDNMRALYFWYMAVGNWWTDCLGPCAKLANFYWIGRAKTTLEHMLKIYPQWGSGRVYFAWACMYTVSPGILGGDMKKAEEYFKKAFDLGPHMSVFYASRARYYQTKLKDRKAFSGDLHHAIAIDPRKADALEYPWAAWYHVNAAQMLKDTDTYFK
ncbi:MAG: hypothetical protein KA369_09695 [Spirochaetes bacterium]|nr:hypothetical protein [Spirochaetota bacterium]